MLKVSSFVIYIVRISCCLLCAIVQGGQFLENPGKSWKNKVVMESPGKSLKSHGHFFCFSIFRQWVQSPFKSRFLIKGIRSCNLILCYGRPSSQSVIWLLQLLAPFSLIFISMFVLTSIWIYDVKFISFVLFSGHISQCCQIFVNYPWFM